ncbi:MAG: hypothetical protein KJ927_04100, partial [Candidatus Eisenbacteria bacterium]|nr:hypothetical protein [Candidatus Eisenbacteria bacterium]
VAARAVAGPNEGLILAVHGNVSGVETGGAPCQILPIPHQCEDLRPYAAPDSFGVEWFIVVAVSRPTYDTQISHVTFGIGDYDPDLLEIVYAQPCMTPPRPLEIPTLNWPGPNSGTTLSWSPACLDGGIQPVYNFGVYAYGPGSIPLDAHPIFPTGVVDCMVDTQKDLFDGMGVMGCRGNIGQNPNCPSEEEMGACCFFSSCKQMTKDKCRAQGGDWVEGPCDEQSCLTAVPTKTSTWGSIKSLYR